MGRGFQLPSGRVIAVGRLLLAALFYLAVWIDVTQPIKAPATGYALLGAYLGFAAVMVVATWRNWWLDARLAGPAHAVDITLFTAVVVVTEGYTSPFFIFFVFLLLAAAIRWGWRETALTAILVTLLYLLVGLFAVTSEQQFDVYRFVIRTGQLVILSLILIWFGVNRWGARFQLQADELLGEPVLDRSPIETALMAAMDGVRSRRGAFVWRDAGTKSPKSVGVVIGEGEIASIELDEFQPGDGVQAPLLYDLPRDRALSRDDERNLYTIQPGEVIDSGLGARLMLVEGITIPIRTDAGQGLLFLEKIRNLSTDHIEVGEQIAADVAAHLQRHALLRAAEESAEARSRLALARDLHDSVVQFLAGAAFRLEAMKRSELSGRSLEPQLNELKQLMLQEQGELRSFITALRSGSQVTLRDLVSDLQALAGRLSIQWDVKCSFSGEASDMTVPTRLHLDSHQLVREAVANAVRHASARTVKIALQAGPDELKLALVNDGKAFPKSRGRIETPQSLRERVEQAGGRIELSRGMNVTKISISLPIRGNRR